MDFEYKTGRCIVLKKEMKDCLVLPKGTYSLSREALLSKEGFDKLKECTSKDNTRNGKCCINRQPYDGCYIIPVGVLHPKVPMLISHAAISGIGTAMAKSPGNGKKKEGKQKPIMPPPEVPTVPVSDVEPVEPILTPPIEESTGVQDDGLAERTERRVKPDGS